MSWNENLNINNLIYRIPLELTAISTLNISGATLMYSDATILSNLNVSGNSNIGLDLSITGDTRIHDDLFLYKLSGASALNLALSTDNNGKVITTNVGGTLLSSLYVSGNSTLQSDLLVSGTTNLQNLNALNITGNGNLKISGTSNIIGSSTFNSSLNISGNAILESGLLIKQAQTNLSSLNVSGQTNLLAPLNFVNNVNILNNGTPVIYPQGNDIYFKNAGPGSLVALHQANDGPTKPIFKTYTNLNGPDGTYSQVVKDSASPANNDDIGGWSYIGNNSNNQEKEYARINVNSDSVLNNAEVGSIRFKNMNNGNLIENMNIKNNEVNINNNLRVSGSTIINQNLTLSSITNASVLATNAQGQIIVGSIPGSSGTIFSTILITSTSGLLRVQNQSSEMANFRSSDNEAFITIGNSGNLNKAGYISYVSSASQIRVGHRGITDILYLNTSGNTNLGIQTSNPSNGALEVRGPGTIAWGDSNGFLKVGAGSTAGFLENMSGQTRLWIPQATNRIGINNTSPAYVIHATDTTRGIMRLNTTTAGTAGVPTYDGIQLFSTTSSGEFGLYSEGNNTNDRVYIRNGADSGIGSNTSGIVIDSSNNVGIKRNSPSYPLDVNGTINSTNLRTNGYIQVFGKVASNGTATFSSNQTITVAKGAGNGYYYMQYNSGWDVGNVMMFTPDNALNIYTITAERSGGGSPSLGIYVYDGTNTRADLGFFFMGWVKI